MVCPRFTSDIQRPVILQWFVEVLPLTYMLYAARHIMLDGARMAEVAFELALLIGISIMLLHLSGKSFRWVYNLSYN